MQRLDDVASPKGNLSGKDYFFLLVLGIISAVVFMFTAKELIVTGVIWYWVPVVITFFLTPYAFSAGNRETYRPGWFYFKALLYWVLILIGSFGAAKFLVVVIRPLLLSIF